MKQKFFETKTTIKIKLSVILEKVNQRHKRADSVMDSVEDCGVESEEQDLSS